MGPVRLANRPDGPEEVGVGNKGPVLDALPGASVGQSNRSVSSAPPFQVYLGDDADGITTLGLR
jgi:hypothetical protein